LKGGEEVVGILRSNPKIKVDPDSGETLFDQEIVSEEAILSQMQKLAELAFALNMHYIQLRTYAKKALIGKDEPDPVE
jgi:hypothetical protein